MLLWNSFRTLLLVSHEGPRPVQAPERLGVDPLPMTPRPFRASARARSGDGKDTTAVPGRVPARGAGPVALGSPQREAVGRGAGLHRADPAQLAAPRRGRPR